MPPRARKWVKLWLELLDDADFRRLNAAARHTTLACIIGAGKCDRDGALATRVGHLSPREIAEWTGYDEAAQRVALRDSVSAGFLIRTGAGWAIADWEQWQAPLDSTERVRKCRANAAEKKRDVTLQSVSGEASGNALEEEVEQDQEGDKELCAASLTPALPIEIPKTIPDDPESLRRVALAFVKAFAQPKTEKAKARDLSAYASTLANARKNYGATVVTAWAAFVTELKIRDGEPMHGGLSGRALVHLERLTTAERESREQAKRYRPNSEAVK